MSPVPTDPYDFTNGGVADAEQVDARFAPLYAALNAGVDETNLAAALKAILGVSDAGTVRSGKSIIATEESRTNAAYGLLTTPDRVSGVVLPTDGLIFVIYRALWKTAGAAGTKAGLFLGANQVKVWDATTNTSQNVEGADTPGSLAGYYPLVLGPSGFFSPISAGVINWSADAATGMLLGLQGPAESAPMDGSQREYGGIAAIAASAGTYDVSVQFKNTGGGAVSAKERKLWVWTRGF
jgi:hypothetical protein